MGASLLEHYNHTYVDIVTCTMYALITAYVLTCHITIHVHVCSYMCVYTIFSIWWNILSLTFAIRAAP